ncbi:MAG: hypothetical protein M0R02_08980 [Bacteroidales bacterium]|nr:hypothetical protein [Bacteroidales bacterium]
MKQVFFLICALGCFACNYESTESPRLVVSHTIDTVNEADNFYVEYSCIKGTNPLYSTQIEFDSHLILDSIIHSQADSITFRYPLSCVNKNGIKTIQIRVDDTKQLQAAAHKKIYIQSITPPNLLLDKTAIYTDTTVPKHSDIQFTIHCIQTEQELDSLFVLKNNKYVSTFSLKNAHFNGDTTTQIAHYTLDSTGVFIFDIRVQDIFAKQNKIIKKITVQ